MISAEALVTSLEILKLEDFYEPMHIKLFGIMSEMYASNKPVDMIMIIDELKARNLFEPIGGQPFLAKIMCLVTTTATTLYYAEIVKGYAFRRRLITAGGNITHIAQNLRVPAPTMMLLHAPISISLTVPCTLPC